MHLIYAIIFSVYILVCLTVSGNSSLLRNVISRNLMERDEEGKSMLSGRSKRYQGRDLELFKACETRSRLTAHQLSCLYNDPRGTVTCTGSCRDGYMFATGESQLSTTCSKSNGTFSPFDKFPDCVPRACQYPWPVTSLYMRCSEYGNATVICEASCPWGYKFPDGETKIRISCPKSFGVFRPEDRISDCVPAGGRN